VLAFNIDELVTSGFIGGDGRAAGCIGAGGFAIGAVGMPSTKVSTVTLGTVIPLK
jgi:hypothetical protein